MTSMLERRVPLANQPTPLEPMDRLGEHLGMSPGSLWVKRDDLTGLAAGGNKARKLEYLCYDALDRGCDVLVTGAGQQSNHCRMTAAAAAKLGLPCVLVLESEKPDAASGNVILDSLLGASVVWCPEGDIDEAIEAECDRQRASGRNPAMIPVGGSVAVGALGYVRAAAELPNDVELSVVATGSCGTHAGLAAGLGDFERVLGVRVGNRADMAARVERIAREAADLAGAGPKGKVVLEERVLGDGYGAVTESGLEAIRLAASLEGLVLDPVYTGKAMAGLIAARRDGRIGPSTKTVFWHTGGMPALFADKYRGLFDVP